MHGTMRDTRDILPRLLTFCLLLFLLACVFDPADKVLSGKVYIFVLCWAITLTFWLSSREPATIPRGLLIYTLLFVLVPLYSIVLYWVTDGSAQFEGFSMLKGYVLITLALMLRLSKTDLLPMLCAVLTVLAVAIIGVFIAVQMVPELLPLMYVFGSRTDMVAVSIRDYGSGVRLLHVYFTTSPMLAISIAYYFDRARAAQRGGKALFLWGLVAINVAGMLLAGTRNNILVSVLLPVVLIFYYARNKAVGAFVSITAVVVLAMVFARELSVFFNPLEASNSTKLAMLDNYARLFSDPATLIFGRGLGAYEDWEGRSVKYVTELTYLEMIRNFGLIGALVMLGLLFFPVWWAFVADQSRTNKAIAIGFTFYLGMCASNPNLFSSMGILILSVMLSAIFLPGSATSWFPGVLLPASFDPARTVPSRT